MDPRPPAGSSSPAWGYGRSSAASSGQFSWATVAAVAKAKAYVFRGGLLVSTPLVAHAGSTATRVYATHTHVSRVTSPPLSVAPRLGGGLAFRSVCVVVRARALPPPTFRGRPFGAGVCFAGLGPSSLLEALGRGASPVQGSVSGRWGRTVGLRLVVFPRTIPESTAVLFGPCRTPVERGSRNRRRARSRSAARQ